MLVNYKKDVIKYEKGKNGKYKNVKYNTVVIFTLRYNTNEGNIYYQLEIPIPNKEKPVAKKKSGKDKSAKKEDFQPVGLTDK